MKSLVALILGTMVPPLLHGAEWTRITSPNFDMYTTGGEREARQTLEVFESVRDFFARVKSLTTVVPVTIVGFQNQREYDPYRVNETSGGHASGDGQRDYIVMSDLADSRTAIHEYVHLLVQDSKLTIPVCLNEGFAEVYSTLQPRGGQVLVGASLAARNSRLASATSFARRSPMARDGTAT